MYDSDWFVGTVVERSDHNSDALVNFMKQSRSGVFSWPSVSKQDQCWVPFLHITCVINAPELKGRSARSYKISDEDTAKIQERLPFFLHKLIVSLFFNTRNYMVRK